MMGTPTTEDDIRTIQEEHRLFGDIVQGSFIESYRNLTLKAVMALKWVTTYCTNAKYVIKVGNPIGTMEGMQFLILVLPKLL